MAEGKVKWFNNAKGYGFINLDNSTDDYFVHFSSIDMQGYRSLKAGQRVQFETLPTDKGIHAINVRLIHKQEVSSSSHDECQSWQQEDSIA